MTTFLNERLFETDLLFRNFFDRNSLFESHVNANITYPVDIKTTSECLCFDIACVGLSKDDVEILVEGNTLRVIYEKPSIESNPSDEEAPHYVHRGITRKSFNLGWKVSPKYNLSKIDAKMENGLLSVTVPVAEESKPKAIKIK